MEVCLIAFTGEANDGNKLMLNVDGVESVGKVHGCIALPLLSVSTPWIARCDRIKWHPEAPLDKWR